MSQENEPELVFEVIRTDAPDNFKRYWDCYWIYRARTVYRDVTYRAWGTDEQEAKKKVFDLIASDKTNGIVRNPGDLVE